MDEFGHILGRAVTGGGNDLPSSLALVVSRATNRLGGAGYYHDVLGNLVQMPAGVDFVTMSYLDQGHIERGLLSSDRTFDERAPVNLC